MNGCKVIDPALLIRFSGAAMRFHPFLDDVCAKYQVNTPARIAAFLAQWCVETNHFTQLHEVFDYTEERLLAVFPSRITPYMARVLGRQPGEHFVPADRQKHIADFVYANRNGNGDEASGDGSLYRGRGLCQLTFKDNYAAYAKAVGVPEIMTNPEHLEQVGYHAVGCGGWFWDNHSLNALADDGKFDDLTRIIHGSVDGSQEARVAQWDIARPIWGAT